MKSKTSGKSKKTKSSSTKVYNPTSWKVTTKNFNFDQDTFPKLSSTNLWHKCRKDLILKAKRQFCYNVLDIDTNDPALTLEGDKLKAYERRNLPLYCVFKQTTYETEIEKQLLRRHVIDTYTRAIYLELIGYHGQSYIGEQARNKLFQEIIVTINNWEGLHTSFCVRWLILWDKFRKLNRDLK